MPNSAPAFIKNPGNIYPIFVGFFSAFAFVMTMLILTDHITMFAVSQAILGSFFAAHAVLDLHNRMWLKAAFMGLTALGSFGVLALIMSGQV